MLSTADLYLPTESRHGQFLDLSSRTVNNRDTHLAQDGDVHEKLPTSNFYALNCRLSRFYFTPWGRFSVVWRILKSGRIFIRHCVIMNSMAYRVPCLLDDFVHVSHRHRDDVGVTFFINLAVIPIGSDF